jgi:CheY-like chemotaxis protein
MKTSKETAGKIALIIDDSFLSRRLHAENLKALGFEISETENGKEALEQIEKNGLEQYSLIIVDMLMPVMSGAEFMLKLKEKYSKPPPVIGCSSKADADLVRTLAKLGIDAYMIKPINSKTFMQKVKDIISSRQK